MIREPGSVIRSQGKRLKQFLKRGLVVMPGAHNALTALQIERAGFPAVYVSGAGLANAALGVPDVGLTTLTEVVTLSGYITRAVNVPVIVDADTGFGGAANLRRAVGAFERIRAAGIHIEDQEFPKRCGHLSGKSLVSGQEMEEKISAACQARCDPDFLIIARTDARAVEGLEGAITRALRYKEAGADVIFPEALESKKEFEAFARRVPGTLMANMTEFGKTPYLSVRQWEAMGYRLVIFPMSALRSALWATEQTLQELKQKGSQKNLLKRMMTRNELYKLIRYEGSVK